MESTVSSAHTLSTATDVLILVVVPNANVLQTEMTRSQSILWITFYPTCDLPQLGRTMVAPAPGAMLEIMRSGLRHSERAFQNVVRCIIVQALI